MLDVLRRHLADPATGWALGGFGALAEFHRAADEPVRTDGDGLGLTTARGRIRIAPRDGLALTPYETLAKDGRHWSQGVIVTLPRRAAEMSRRAVLTELGADDDDGDGVLFDLGVGLANVDACVRVVDDGLAESLRRAEGEALFSHADAAATACASLLAASPTRLFVSAAGRIDVAGPIPPPAGETPVGPHTHVMPELLARRRTHAANVPVPRGHLPVLAFFPPNPARDVYGTPTSFDAAAHAAFQKLMTRFAPVEVRRAKARVRDAVAAGRGPEDGVPPRQRKIRTAMRVAIRQIAFEQGDSSALSAWRRLLEPARSRRRGDPAF